MKQKHIIFLHFVTGDRDGVSLEIEKRAQLVEEMGHTVSIVTGINLKQRKNVYQLSSLNIRSKENRHLYELIIEDKTSEDDLKKLVKERQSMAYEQLSSIFKKLQPDLVFAHNILSHGRNMPASIAMYEVIEDLEIKTVAINHDIWFDRDVYLKIKSPFVREILSLYPRKSKYILEHQVINSIAKDSMKKRVGIEAVVTTDFFDYKNAHIKYDVPKNDLYKRLNIPKDNFVILHATRITGRKAIENAILVAKVLQGRFKNIENSFKYNDKEISSNTNVTLLLSNYVEVAAEDYAQELQFFAKKKWS